MGNSAREAFGLPSPHMFGRRLLAQIMRPRAQLVSQGVSEERMEEIEAFLRERIGQIDPADIEDMDKIEDVEALRNQILPELRMAVDCEGIENLEMILLAIIGNYFFNGFELMVEDALDEECPAQNDQDKFDGAIAGACEVGKRTQDIGAALRFFADASVASPYQRVGKFDMFDEQG